MTSRIDALARRLAGDPFLLASALAEYAQSESLDDRGLAEALGCPLEVLSPLRLCRRPRPGAHLFREDVQKIATRFSVRAEVLAEAVRRAYVLGRLCGAATAGQPGMLIAARDRLDDQEIGGQPEGEKA